MSFINNPSVINPRFLPSSIFTKNWTATTLAVPGAANSDLTVSVTANTTWTIASNKLHAAQTLNQGTASEYAYFNQYKTNLEDFSIEATFQQTAAIGAATYGPAFGIQNSQYNFFALIFCSTTLNGKIRFYQTSGAGAATPVVITTSGSAISGGVAQNDLLHMRLTFLKNVVTCTVTNLTVSGQPTLTLSYTFPMYSTGNIISGQPIFMPASGNAAVFSIGGTSDVEYFNYSQPKVLAAKTIFIGDSITRGYYCGTVGSPNAYANRFADLVYPDSTKYIMQAGAGNESAQAASQLRESLLFNCQYAVVCLGVNDILDSVAQATCLKNIIFIIKSLQDCGTTVVLLNLPPVNGQATGINNMNTAFASLAASDPNIILVDINTPLNNGSNAYKPADTDDNIHPNSAGHLVIANTIIAAVPQLA